MQLAAMWEDLLLLRNMWNFKGTTKLKCCSSTWLLRKLSGNIHSLSKKAFLHLLQLLLILISQIGWIQCHWKMSSKTAVTSWEQHVMTWYNQVAAAVMWKVSIHFFLSRHKKTGQESIATSMNPSWPQLWAPWKERQRFLPFLQPPFKSLSTHKIRLHFIYIK